MLILKKIIIKVYFQRSYLNISNAVKITSLKNSRIINRKIVVIPTAAKRSGGVSLNSGDSSARSLWSLGRNDDTRDFILTFFLNFNGKR